MFYVIAGVIGLAVGALVGRMLAGRTDVDADVDRIKRDAEARQLQLREDAEKDARARIEVRVKEIDAEASQRRSSLKQREGRLSKRESELDKRNEQLGRQSTQITRREGDLGRREGKLGRQEAEVEQQLEEARTHLKEVASLDEAEARQILLEEVREQAMRESVDRVRIIEQEAKALADERARMIVAGAIQRYASEHVSQRTVTSVALPSEDMKGRIIGREGRNIRAYESATGCDLIIDDAPDTVAVSTFNPVRREVGRIALERLLADGRIHPARIEEVVSRTRKEMDQIVRKRGEEAVLELELTKVPVPLIKLLGRLYYVESFAQNVLRHSVEVAFLAGVMASELGLKPEPFRRAGLLHDIGKAIDHDQVGSHAAVGAEACRKHGESKAIVTAVASHHEERPQSTILAQLVAAANTLSSSRPGARSDTLAAYIKRLSDLETLAMSFDGVDRCFAIQAGQEIRVMVDNTKLSDRDADVLARDIARRIQQDLSYSGQIRVAVTRTTRAVQYAR